MPRISSSCCQAVPGGGEGAAGVATPNSCAKCGVGSKLGALGRVAHPEFPKAFMAPGLGALRPWEVEICELLRCPSVSQTQKCSI